MTSSFVSSVGTWMQSVALGIYLTETTRNPLWLGLVDGLGVDACHHRLARRRRGR